MITTTYTRILIAALGLLALATSTASAGREQFYVIPMQDTDPSADMFSSVSGTCVPSHDRERLDCYFVRLSIYKRKTPEAIQKELSEFDAELNKGSPEKAVQDLRKRLCDGTRLKGQRDPAQLKYSALARALVASSEAFCERPSRDTLVSWMHTLVESEATECACLVADWRSTLIRQERQWVETSPPAPFCGYVTVFALEPEDIKQMKEPLEPGRWILHEKTVKMPGRSESDSCRKLFQQKEGTRTYSSKSAGVSVNCSEYKFTGTLEGTANPRGPKGK
jgi:hypothetical protein